MSFTESEINPGFPTERDATTASVRGNFAIAQREISAINEVIATALTGAPYLPLAGGELTGRLLLPGGDPGHLRAAVTQGWVQSYVEGESGAGLPEAPTDGEIYGRGNRLWSSVLPLAGGVLTGALTLAGAPTVALHAASKAYTDSLPFLPLAGGTLTGDLMLAATLFTDRITARTTHVTMDASAGGTASIKGGIAASPTGSGGTVQIHSGDLPGTTTGNAYTGNVSLSTASVPYTVMGSSGILTCSTGQAYGPGRLTGRIGFTTGAGNNGASSGNITFATGDINNDTGGTATRGRITFDAGGGVLTIDAAGFALAGDPTLSLHATTKAYVDAALAALLERVTALEARR